MGSGSTSEAGWRPGQIGNRPRRPVFSTEPRGAWCKMVDCRHPVGVAVRCAALDQTPAFIMENGIAVNFRQRLLRYRSPQSRDAGHTLHRAHATGRWSPRYSRRGRRTSWSRSSPLASTRSEAPATQRVRGCANPILLLTSLAPQALADERTSTAADLIATLLPAVVNITIVRYVRAGAAEGNMAGQATTTEQRPKARASSSIRPALS